MTLESLVKKLKNLPQNKDKSEEELLAMAKSSLDKEEVLGSLNLCLPGEEKFAKNLLNKYLASKSFENPAERDTLRNLIDFSIILERLKSYINGETTKSNPVPPVQMIDQLQKFSEHIEDLKERLNLVSSKDEKKETVNVISDLTERFHKWANRPENRGLFEFQCSKCGEIFLINRRIDKEKDEVREHPWFSNGNILMNKQIFIDLELGKISIDQVARYLNTSQDYVKWLQINYPLSQDKEEEIEELDD